MSSESRGALAVLTLLFLLCWAASALGTLLTGTPG